MSAADVIAGWRDQLQQEGSFMQGVAVATQTGNPAIKSSSVVAFATITVNSTPDGLSSPESSVVYSDRYNKATEQLFDVTQSDSSEFVLTLAGDLFILSHTWGGNETFPLTDLGNGVLGGFGVNSIGNKGVPPYWTITLNQFATEPQ